MTYFFPSLFSSTYSTGPSANLLCVIIHMWTVADAATWHVLPHMFSTCATILRLKLNRDQCQFLRILGLPHQKSEKQGNWAKAALLNISNKKGFIRLPFPSAADPLSLHQVRAVSEAGCVTQEDRESTDVQCRLDYVPGGASNGRHNGCRSLAWM